MVLYVIISEDIEDSLILRKQVRENHLARLNALQAEGKLVLAGPHPKVESDNAPEAGFSGSLIVAEFENLKVAENWADNDPYTLAGVFKKCTVKPFKRVF